MAGERFDPNLLAAIKRVLAPGDVLATLDRGNRNEVGAISEAGIEVTTDHSGTPVLVPAWMFNEVWSVLRARTTVRRDEVDNGTVCRAVKRSSLVFAVLSRLPNVEVEATRPLALRIRPGTTGP